jgi:hypothetical protein
VSEIPCIWVIDKPPHADVHLYYQAAEGIWNSGKMPYRDFVLEYPPYAIPIFFAPGIFGRETYGLSFKLLAVLADLIIKYLLFKIGQQAISGIRSLLPLAAYSFALPFIRYFLFQRYDLFPALVSLLILVLFWSKKYTAAGVAVVFGAGLKLYPLLFLPPLFLVAFKEGMIRRFTAGILVGAVPILVLTPFAPWWRFLAFHAERGLQAESLYASLLWLAHLIGGIPAKWEGGHRCTEVHGIFADTIVPWARLCFAFTVASSSLLVCWGAVRRQIQTIADLTTLVMIPLLAFVAFNQVFSPQFLIWLLPLNAIMTLNGSGWRKFIVPLATALTPLFFPSPGYDGEGITLLQSGVLVSRNLMLVGLWISLMFDLLKQSRFGRFGADESVQIPDSAANPYA